MATESDIVKVYNELAGRNIKVLPREKRVKEALEAFDVEDFRNTFLWAQNDEWCKSADILKTRIGWICSYDVVAQHSDFQPPKEEAPWQ